ncbi:MAG: 23S rRNA (guanosine(2251)-2'-O)-methyltransferase RlmB [Thermodesulfovibrionales bacterium]
MKNRRPTGGPKHTAKDSRNRRSESREEWIYGLNPVFEAGRSGRGIRTVFISSSRTSHGGVEQLLGLLSQRNITVKRVDEAFFDDRFPKGHQGIAATAEPRRYADFDALLAAPALKGESPLFLLLDCIKDPRNFGAILRTADAGGVHGVVIQAHRSVSLTPEAVKTSAGASEHMPVAMVPNIKHAIWSMQEQGALVVGADADATVSVWDADLSGPLGIVIGAEGEGMRRTVREDCDLLVSLPMRGRVNSLNASVAAGVIIFEAIRQRRGKTT